MASFAQLEVTAPQAGVILKHKVGSGARGLLDYSASKATDIDGIITNKPIYSNVSETPRSIAKEFGFLRRLWPRLNKAVGHVIIAPKTKFQTQADWEKAASIATREHGIENTAFACYLHTDTEHPHLHLVYSRIRFDGSVVSDSNSYKTNERAARKIESELNIPALREKPRWQRPIDSQVAYAVEKRETRVRKKEIKDERRRYFSHTAENQQNGGKPRPPSEKRLHALSERGLAHNRGEAAQGVLQSHARPGGREFGGLRWGAKSELIGITPTPTPKPKKRRMKMTTQNKFQKIEEVARGVLSDPAVDSPVEFKLRLDAALAEAEIEAFTRFHCRGKDDDAEISGWSLMFSQGTSVAASNISRGLSWAHILAELNANAARRRRRDESAALAEEALGFLLLRPAQAIPAQGEEAPRRARVGDGQDQDEPAPGPSWSWPSAAADGIYETRDALAIRPDFIGTLSPAELQKLVFRLLDRAEKKWGVEPLRVGAQLLEHPQLLNLFIDEAASRPSLHISEPPEVAEKIAAARAARAAAGAGLSPAAPLDFLVLAFSAAEPASAPAAAVGPAPVVSAPVPLPKTESEEAKTANLVAELRGRVAHARGLFSSAVPAVLSAAQLERLDAAGLRARLVELEGSAAQAAWVASAGLRHESERHALSGVAAERVLLAFEGSAKSGFPRRTFAAREAAVLAAQALSDARAGLDRAGPFRWLAATARKSELAQLEAAARSSKIQWQHEKSAFLREHAEEINRFEARQAVFAEEERLLTSSSEAGSYLTNASWTPEVLERERAKVLDRLVLAERRENDELLRKQERERLIERSRSGDDSQDDEDRQQQQVRYERER